MRFLMEHLLTEALLPESIGLCMLLADEPNIREVIAFPKNQSARDLMGNAPSSVEPGQLEELHINVNLE